MNFITEKYDNLNFIINNKISELNLIIQNTPFRGKFAGKGILHLMKAFEGENLTSRKLLTFKNGSI
jgi:hypothetical protein